MIIIKKHGRIWFSSLPFLLSSEVLLFRSSSPSHEREVPINEKNLWKKHVWSGHERPHPKIRMRSLWFIACVTRQCWMIMDGVKRQLPTQQMWFERSTLYRKGERGGEPSKPATVTLKRYVGYPPHDGPTDGQTDE